VGLGLWTPRVVPWIKLEATDWLGSEGDGAKPELITAPPEASPGIVGGGQPVPLTPKQAEDLRAKVEKAMGAGHSAVSLAVGDKNVCVPASNETLAVLAKLESAGRRRHRDRPCRDGTPPVRSW
jgi:hypothetical protein